MRTLADIFFKIMIMRLNSCLSFCLIGLFAVSCASAPERIPVPGTEYTWMASYYADDFHGKPTASGEIFNMYAMTAAHKTLPFGTRLRVKNFSTGKSVTVTVNDRGPFVKGRQIDLSYGAAKALGMIRSGTSPVRVVVIDRDIRYARYIKYGNIAAKGEITVQVGSFRDRGNANRLKDILSHRYKGVYMYRARVRGDDYFRVCVGKFDSKESAEGVAQKLADEGYEIIVVSTGDKA